MEETEPEQVKYKCSDCGRVFFESFNVENPECPECGSQDVTSIEKVR
jgi:DNA-directed RNA polymerase subunit RPC12/RpoP